MTRLILGFILSVILSLMCIAPPAHASVHLPSEVTDDIAEPELSELSARKTDLLIRRDSIKLRVAIHNAKCSNVTPGSSVIDECRTNQGRLQTEISDYAAAVNAFNTMVFEAPRTPDTPEYTPTLSEYIIKYFLIYREESDKIYNEMIDASAAWQSSLQEEIRNLEEEIFPGPVKQKKFNETNQAIYNRRDSAINRINSLSLENMLEEMNRLKQEGYYKDGDDLIERDNNDPDFHNAVNEAVRNVLIRQYEAEYIVRQKALNEMQSAASELRNK